MLKLQKGQYQILIVKIWKWSGIGLGAFLLYILAVQFNLFWLFGGMPSPQELENPKSKVASVLFSEDGKELGNIFVKTVLPLNTRNFPLILSKHFSLRKMLVLRNIQG